MFLETIIRKVELSTCKLKHIITAFKWQAVHDVINFNSIQFYFVFVFTYKCKNHLPLQLVLELITIIVIIIIIIIIMTLLTAFPRGGSLSVNI